MPQFEFLVMTEKTFIVIKYFRFEFIFYVKIATPPPKKSHPLFPSNLPLKVDVLSSPFFLKIWLGGGGAHYEYLYKTCIVLSDSIIIVMYILSW